MDDLATDFDLAVLARREEAGQTAETLSARNKAAEDALYDSWRRWRIRTNQPARDFLEGKCIRGRCRGRALNVRLYQGPRLRVVQLPGMDERVHVCARLFCGQKAQLHRKLLPESAAGLAPFYWCQLHGKIHACDNSCTETYIDEMNNVTCLVSALFKTGITQFSFDDGSGRATVSTVSSELESKAAAEDEAARSAQKQVLRRQRFLNQRVGVYAATPEVVCNDPRVISHEDHPMKMRFEDDVNRPLLPDDGRMMTALYWQSYECVFRLLFSHARSDIEERKHKQAVNRATRAVRSYIEEQLKHDELIFVSTCAAIWRREMSKRHIYPHIKLPPHPCLPRLCAHYSLLAVEFYVQLIALCDAIEKAAPKTTNLDNVNQMRSHPFRAVVPNIYDMFHEGFSDGALVVLPVDWLMQMFPESSTIKQLGWDEKTCTKVKTHIKSTIRLARTLGISLRHIVATTVDLNEVMWGKGSVLPLFFEARRRRLAELVQ